ncbi:hypothetical protein CC86DRAFT_406178 [Ophiobolus disseminans]|uniref:Uncharacterized protein n=1 Tax=Ophiobolus disseminans TaxID=1469910 RepID=A0A6A7A0T9_9PLEO|nr:hypothetical protein CC86DRAFT_406178 [Ophiobolus disseminans]
MTSIDNLLKLSTELSKLGSELTEVGGKLAQAAATLQQEAANIAEELSRQWGVDVSVNRGEGSGRGEYWDVWMRRVEWKGESDEVDEKVLSIAAGSII